MTTEGAEPPAGKAAGEGSGGGGGALICPFCHPKSAVNTSDPKDCTCKKDCGQSKCPKAESSKGLTPAVVGDSESSKDDNVSSTSQFSASLEDALTKALEAAAW